TDGDLVALANDIHEASTRLIKIVTNFLDAARLERGQMPLSLVALKLDEPVQTVTKELEALAAEKKLYVKAELPTSLPMAMADKERVEQVIYNLAGNAMKF